MRINFDTDELRQRWAIMHERKDLDMFFASLMTALESERQRADDAESQIERITAQRLQENSMNLKVKLHLNERATNAEAELAALKGDRLPYAYSYNYAGCETCEGFQNWRKELSRERPPEWMVETGKVTDLVELFTAPQKPVVLPDKKALNPNDPSPIWCASKEWNSAIDTCRAAIKAAGGVVKDGE